MTSALRRTAAAAGLAGILVPLCAVPALAAADPVTGYWSRTRLGLLPVEPPDRVPEGGSFVAADPAGPVAVSALRGDADPGNVVVGLRLPVADAIGTVAVQVCPTTERWVPVQGGRLEAAPTADCSAPVDARVEDDSLVVDLPPELQRDAVDVLLRPKDGSAFSLTLEKATAAAVVQAPASSALPPVPAPAPPPAESGGFAPPPAFESGGTFDNGFSGGALLPPPDAGVPALAGEPLLPPPALPEPAAAAAPPAPAALAAQPAIAPLDRTASLLAVALLVALAAVALRLAVQPAVAPRHLGGGARLSRAGAVAPSVASPAGPAAAAPAAGAAERGVGRFRSGRVRPPVRI